MAVVEASSLGAGECESLLPPPLNPLSGGLDGSSVFSARSHEKRRRWFGGGAIGGEVSDRAPLGSPAQSATPAESTCAAPEGTTPLWRLRLAAAAALRRAPPSKPSQTSGRSEAAGDDAAPLHLSLPIGSGKKPLTTRQVRIKKEPFCFRLQLRRALDGFSFELVQVKALHSIFVFFLGAGTLSLPHNFCGLPTRRGCSSAPRPSSSRTAASRTGSPKATRAGAAAVAAAEPGSR